LIISGRAGAYCAAHPPPNQGLPNTKHHNQQKNDAQVMAIIGIKQYSCENVDVFGGAMMMSFLTASGVGWGGWLIPVASVAQSDLAETFAPNVVNKRTSTHFIVCE
jgi:hypothetical protein